MLNVALINERLNYAEWLENLGGREHLGGIRSMFGGWYKIFLVEWVLKIWTELNYLSLWDFCVCCDEIVYGKAVNKQAGWIIISCPSKILRHSGRRFIGLPCFYQRCLIAISLKISADICRILWTSLTSGVRMRTNMVFWELSLM